MCSENNKKKNYLNLKLFNSQIIYLRYSCGLLKRMQLLTNIPFFFKINQKNHQP